MRAIILFLACLLPLEAQSPSYGMVARPGAIIDYRNAATVLPDRHLASDPATCVLGERYFNTSTAKTRRCIATDIWSDDGGGTYSLPAATASILGGVKVGTNLAIDGNGVLSATGGSGPACDPFDLSWFCLAEDFVTGSTTNGQVGKAGLLWNALNSGTLNYYNVSSASDTAHPGLLRILSTTSVNSGGTISAANTSTTANINFSTLMNNEWELRWIVKAESTADTRLRVGITQSAAAAPATGEMTMGFRYDTDAAFSDHTKNTAGSWVAQFCGYSSGSCADTGGVYKVLNVTPDTNWHLFSLRRSGTTYYWKIDNTDVATMCASGCDMTTPAVTNPVNAVPPAPRVNFAISGTTQRGCMIDYLSWKVAGYASRY